MRRKSDSDINDCKVSDLIKHVEQDILIISTEDRMNVFLDILNNKKQEGISPLILH